MTAVGEPVRVGDFSGTVEVADEVELERVMSGRYGGGVNGFWLCHRGQELPALSILVSGDLAYLHYFPNRDHAGFRSSGMVEGLKPGGLTTFSMTGVEDEVEILNDAIVPFSIAIRVAREFLRSNELPRSIDWVEL